MTGPVLGVNFGTHDAAAAVVHDGTVLAAAEEERFTRHKHTKAFPAAAIDFCLGSAGVRPQDLSSVAFFVDPGLQRRLPVVNTWAAFPGSLGSLRSDVGKSGRGRAQLVQMRHHPVLSGAPEVTPVPHHRAHAASAYLTCDFDDAVVVTFDGRGEYETACIFEGREGQLRKRHATLYPHSVGYFYSMFTRYLGFRPQHDEYKVMGLAGYGDDSLVTRVRQIISVDPARGRIRLDLRYFDHHRRPSPARHLYSDALVEILGSPREPAGPLTDRHRAVAFAAQHVLEEVVLGYLRFARRLVGLRSLCLAGGVALNGVANRLVLESGEFDQVYVQPAAGDAGTSIGAALLRDRALGTTTRAAMRNAFLGPDYPEAAITKVLDGLQPEEHHVERATDPAAAAARLLAQDAIIGWFQGRAEFGPRALGARSILSAANDAGVTARINARIKRRELFRPLAPAILDTAADKYFAIASGTACVSVHAGHRTGPALRRGTHSGGGPRGRFRTGANRLRGRQPGLRPAATGVRGAHRRPGRAEHLVQRRGRTHRRQSGRCRAHVPRLPIGRAGDRSLRGPEPPRGEEEQHLTGARGLAPDHGVLDQAPRRARRDY